MPLEAIFVIARVAGWIAHALEEYGERPLRFRARALTSAQNKIRKNRDNIRATTPHR
jgi:citrate synthase